MEEPFGGGEGDSPFIQAAGNPARRSKTEWPEAEDSFLRVLSAFVEDSEEDNVLVEDDLFIKSVNINSEARFVFRRSSSGKVAVAGMEVVWAELDEESSVDDRDNDLICSFARSRRSF